MALKITAPIKAQGISLESAYVRLAAEVNSTGEKVKVNADWYVDKAAYTSNVLNMLPVSIEYKDTEIKVENTKIFPYNRESDGSDVLTFGHDKYKDYLASIPHSEQEEYTEILIEKKNITKADL